MCGFIGAIGPWTASEEARARLAQALPLLRHRGPDREAIAVGSGWMLGFCRLSIQDLRPTADQPMYAKDRSSVIVFNGEIYNFRTLARELLSQGDSLTTTGDTEVLLSLLARQGRAALPRLNGMFALAHLDLKSGQFLLVRDRLGVKPLYLATQDDTLFFASEIPALLSLLPHQPELDLLAVHRYLALGFVPPPQTIWKNIHKLEPGHLLAGELASPLVTRIERWWDLPFPEAHHRDTDQALDALLADATSQRLVADVPVGVFLSSGVDSSLVTHYVQHSPNGASVRALTVSFSEDARVYDETGPAQAWAQKLGIEHVRVPALASILDELPRIAWHCGEPFSDSSVVNQYILCRAAKQVGTVFLSGDGGDEALAGYSEYIRLHHHGAKLRRATTWTRGWPERLASRLPVFSPWAQRLMKLSCAGDRFGASVRNNFRDPIWSYLVADRAAFSRDELEEPVWRTWQKSAGLPLVTRMQRFDYQMYLEPDVLVKVDRASMAHAVEVRSPLLDYRLVEWAQSLLPEDLIQNGQGKAPLRRLLGKHQGQALQRLPKRGFGLPIEKWIGQTHERAVRDLLLDPEAAMRGIWAKGALERVLDRNAKTAGHPLSGVVWRCLMLELWGREFLHRNLAVRGDLHLHQPQCS